jgi:hypothetical protein
MTTGQLILILLLVLVAAVLVALILRRGSARREEQRVEAADLRSQAEAVAPTVAGRAAFAEQAEQRADVARAEADEKAREAARLEEEAAEQRRGAEAARQEHEAILRRADDVDPDVKESQYPPVPEAARPEPAPSEGEADASSDGEPAATDGDEARDDTDQPMTRAERRRAREEAEARGEDAGARGAEDADRAHGAESPGESTWASGPAAPIAGAAGAAAVGTAAWAAHDGREGADEERSARIASAADYRDDVEGGGDEEPRRSEDVSTDHRAGTEEGMNQDQRSDATTDTSETADRGLTDTESPRGEWGEARDGNGERDADAGRVEMVDDIDAYAATEPTLTEDQSPAVEPERPADDADRADRADRAEGSDGPGADAGDRGPGAGERERPAALATQQGASPGDVEEEGTDAVVVADIESYASTEPVLADGSRAGERDSAREGTAADGTGGEREGAAGEPLGAEPAGDATPADEESQAAVAGERTEEERDWGSDEGRMLDENRERGDRLAADRESLGDQAPADTTDEGDHGSSDAPAMTGRRVSEFHEIRDGGFGVGSAAPLEDGAQPMGHPIAAHRDSMTFRGPGDAGYDDSQPDVWFYDEGAAEQAGFRRSEG